MSSTETAPAVPDGGSVPAVPDHLVRPEGLEDLDHGDLVMPMIQIVHKTAVFKDNLSNREYDKIDGVLLGLIKQRVLWPPEVEEGGSMPLCKSYNHKIGHPDMKDFPWKASGFTRPADEDAIETLPCENCKLQEWGTHPKRDAPWCSEQHTFALLVPIGEPGDDAEYAPALFTLQRSGIKPSRQYMTAFVRDKKPLYVCRTVLSLEARRRGTNDFAVPKFAEGPATSQDDWPMYASEYRRIREFVQTPRNREDEEGPVESSTSSGEPPASGGDAGDDDDELPF